MAAAWPGEATNRRIASSSANAPIAVKDRFGNHAVMANPTSPGVRRAARRPLIDSAMNLGSVRHRSSTNVPAKST